MQNLTFRYFPLLESGAVILPQCAYTWETIVTEKIVVQDREMCLPVTADVWDPVPLMWEA